MKHRLGRLQQRLQARKETLEVVRLQSKGTTPVASAPFSYRCPCRAVVAHQ